MGDPAQARDAAEPARLSGADLDAAVRIADTAKTQRYGTCNTMETLLVASAVNDLLGDPVATVDLLEQYRDEVKWRVEHGIKGHRLSARPKRLLICGSCVGPNGYQVERAG